MPEGDLTADLSHGREGVTRGRMPAEVRAEVIRNVIFPQCEESVKLSKAEKPSLHISRTLLMEEAFIPPA